MKMSGNPERGREGLLPKVYRFCSGRLARNFILPALLAAILLYGCSPGVPGEVSAPEKPEPPTVRVRITAVGDFLMHTPLVTTSRDPGTGRYDFRDILKECRDHLSSPDFTLANLETRLAGPARGYSGYPLFNTPADLAASMREIGIDLVATANNHSLDMGREGVIATLDNLDLAGLQHLGTHRSPRERDTPPLFEIRGVKVGFLNYTEHTNGIPVPRGESHLVNLINQDQIGVEIARLKAEGCELIIAYMHFGAEYQRQPNRFQRELARQLFDSGVDVVLGSHCHVLQPMEWLTATRDGKTKRGLVAYSLGNFVSNQHWRYSDCGIILNLDIVRKPGEEARVEAASYIPVWMHRYSRGGRIGYRVLPVGKAIRDFEGKRDPLITAADYLILKQAWDDTVSLIGPDFAPAAEAAS